MNKLSEKEIEAIRKRAEKATEGSWAHEILCHEQRRYTVGSFKGDLTVIGDIANEEDAEFIVHAREYIPKLLAEIERSRELLVKAYQYGVSSEAYQKDGDIKEIREYTYGGDDE